MLVVDVQTALMEGHPYNEVLFIENIQKLLISCRKKKLSVIYVRHYGGIRDELEYNTAGWQIFSEIAPLQSEIIFDKSYNSAFRQTGLQKHLNSIKAKNIILVGLMTEYCIDATCKVAFELGYDVTIPEGATSTVDNDFASGKALTEYHENKIWNNRFSRVIPVEQILAELEKNAD